MGRVTSVQIPPLVVLALAAPVYLLGEQLVRRVGWLARFNIPVPVVGGFCFAAITLALKLTALLDVQLAAETRAATWTWLVSTHGEWRAREPKPLILPLIVLFYMTLGMGASWELVRRGGVLLVLFVASTGVAAVLQNVAGVAAARAMGEHAALGLMCGSVSLMGGFSTAIGFSPQLEARFRRRGHRRRRGGDVRAVDRQRGIRAA